MSNVVAAILLGNGVGGRMAIAPHYNMIEHIYECTFVDLSYNYRICFNEQTKHTKFRRVF